MKTLICIYIFLTTFVHSQIINRDFGTDGEIYYGGRNYRIVKIAQTDAYYNVSWKRWLLDDIRINDMPHLLDIKTQEGQTGVGYFVNAVVDSAYFNFQGAMKVCPEGWRIPRIGEWDTLLRLTSQDQRAYMFGSHNGFKGYHSDTSNIKVTQVLKGGFWWSSTTDGDRAYVIKIEDSLFYEWGIANIWDCASVRCIKDEEE